MIFSANESLVYLLPLYSVEKVLRYTLGIVNMPKDDRQVLHGIGLLLRPNPLYGYFAYCPRAFFLDGGGMNNYPVIHGIKTAYGMENVVDEPLTITLYHKPDKGLFLMEILGISVTEYHMAGFVPAEQIGKSRLDIESYQTIRTKDVVRVAHGLMDLSEAITEVVKW